MPDYFKNFPRVQYGDKFAVNLVKRVKLLETIENDPYAFLPYTIKDEDRPEDIAQYYYNDVNKVWLIYLANNIIDPYTQWPKSSSVLEQIARKRFSAEFQFTSSSIDSITITGAHPFLETDPVLYSSENPIVGLTNLMTYYVVNRTPTTFRLSLTPRGTPITISSAGTTHTLTRNLDIFLMSTNLESNVSYYKNDQGEKISEATFRLDTTLNSAEWQKVTYYDEMVDGNEARRTIWLVNTLYADRLQAQLRKLYEQ
jgi:hypothetical protein